MLLLKAVFLLAGASSQRCPHLAASLQILLQSRSIRQSLLNDDSGDFSVLADTTPYHISALDEVWGRNFSDFESAFCSVTRSLLVGDAPRSLDEFDLRRRQNQLARSFGDNFEGGINFSVRFVSSSLLLVLVRQFSPGSRIPLEIQGLSPERFRLIGAARINNSRDEYTTCFLRANTIAEWYLTEHDSIVTRMDAPPRDIAPILVYEGYLSFVQQ